MINRGAFCAGPSRLLRAHAWRPGLQIRVPQVFPTWLTGAATKLGQSSSHPLSLSAPSRACHHSPRVLEQSPEASLQ